MKKKSEKSPKNRRELNCHVACSVEVSLSVIGGKWKAVVLYHLLSGTKRFSELKRLVPSVSQRMLTQQLRELEQDTLINRKIYAQVPPKVEYTLTELGESLAPILHALRDWGRSFRNTLGLESS
ncbi:MAG: helix-turn-helix transcriptional regulator [Legionella sp.]|nr:helix-turn-helix transcriptional regulator [Legionella sp.]